MQIKQLTILLFFIILIIACEKSTTESAKAESTGKGGSLARFTIADNHLYLADYTNLEVYDISGTTAIKKNSIPVGWGIETIFPYKDKLFIGSREGMFIYSISNPDQPVKLGSAMHLRSCDPVVAEDNYSYVTLQGNGRCGAAEDGLYIYDIKNVMVPKQLSLLRMATPFGLGLKDSVVFVCRGTNGLTAVNVKDRNNPKEMYTINDASFMDVIPIDQLLICYVTNGLLLYDISNLRSIVRIGDFRYN